MKAIYWTLIAICFAIGTSMYAWGFQYSWYTVQENALWELSSRLENEPRDQRFKKWYEERQKLETPRKSLQDAGQGLICLSVLLALLRRTTGFPLKEAKTPKRRWMHMVIYLAALAIQIPCSFLYFTQRQARHDYPSWGDSIGIPIAQSIINSIICAVVGSLLWWPFLAKAGFPANLYEWPPNQRRFNIIVTIGCGLFMALSLSSIGYDVVDGNIGPIIGAVAMIYLLLSIRAGLVTRKTESKMIPNHAVEGMAPR